MTITDASTPGYREPDSDGKRGVFHIHLDSLY